MQLRGVGMAAVAVHAVALIWELARTAFLTIGVFIERCNRERVLTSAYNIL